MSIKRSVPRQAAEKELETIERERARFEAIKRTKSRSDDKKSKVEWKQEK